jgi:SAM-dependent methyltransferase
MKAIILIMKSELYEALDIIENGLKIDSKNFDLLYNKAYIKELQKKYKEAYRCYNKSISFINDQSIKEQIKEKLEYIKNIDNIYALNGNLSVFTVDDNLNADLENFIINYVHEFGYTILKIIDIEEPKIIEKGIAKIIVLYDLEPVEMEYKDLDKFTDIDNKRYFNISYLSTEVKLKFNMDNVFNHIYLTKNEDEAKKIIEELLPQEVKNIYNEIHCIEKNYSSDYEVIHKFNSFRHRSKAELIRYRDGLAVKKTWKPNNEKFFIREKFAYGELSKKISYIPILLESGENYIIIPYYKDLLNKNEESKKIILTSHIIDVATYFKQLFEAGYYNPDIHPGQFLYSKEEGLIAIDFEYLQEYNKKPDSLFESYDIVGYPKNFQGDKPNYIGQNLHQWYDELWIKYTGYNLIQIAEIAYKKYEKNDGKVDKVLGLLNYAKTSGKTYNGSLYDSAYHSLELKGYYFRGQRECNLRLKKIPYDFKDKIVLDIGCNVGGMLHSLSDKIAMGIGIDYDYRLINAANAIKTINISNNLSFYMFDLENEELNLINNYILSNKRKVDICFLLSICMWIKNWREVVKFVSTISDNLLFETNGTENQQLEQIRELKKYYNNINLVEKVSNDDPGQPYRTLLLCNNSLQLLECKSNDNKKKINKYGYNIDDIQGEKLDSNDELYRNLINDFYDFEFYRNYCNAINNIEPIKGVVTGLSYFEVGVNTNLFTKNYINLALSSQDIFYDYYMIRYVFDNLNSNIEEIILGLSNYSFNYDLSLTQNSKTKRRPLIYYPLLKKAHNFSTMDKEIKKYNKFMVDNNFIINFMTDFYERTKEEYHINWQKIVIRKFNELNLDKDQINQEIYVAKRWDKQYYNTIKENIFIFNKMLTYLKRKNVKVTIVTNPVTNFYKSYFSTECRNNFLDIISDFQKKFQFNFIDGYNMDCFQDSDFYDSSHLNKNGAYKFTNIIKEQIE